MVIYQRTDEKNREFANAKGNQTKIHLADSWFKIDFLGYEGAAEMAVSEFLKKSNLSCFVSYKMEDIHHDDITEHGCVSKNFKPEEYEIYTLEQLFQLFTGFGSNSFMDNKSVLDCIRDTIDFIEDVTGLEHVGKYLTTLLEIDAIVLNEDRHTNNIAFLCDENGKFSFCPIFDNGDSFLSDCQYKHPNGNEPVHSKPFSMNFETQVGIFERLYGKQLQLTDTELISPELLSKIEEIYGKPVAERMESVALKQKEKAEIYVTPKQCFHSPLWESGVSRECKELLGGKEKWISIFKESPDYEKD